MKEGKKVLITSWYFYPELTPRAFRTHELVKEFCRRGHRVTLLLPYKEEFLNQKFEHKNLTTHYVGAIIPKPTNFTIPQNEVQNKRSLIRRVTPEWIKDIIRNWREFKVRYFPRVWKSKDVDVFYRELMKIEDGYSLLFSVGLPIIQHIAGAKALRRNKTLKKIPVTIAEYGDPFSARQKDKIFFLHYFTDLFIAQTFCYIAVPNEYAVKSYLRFKNRNKILVLPQAFNFNEYSIEEYTPHSKSTFAYCGVFYNKLRDPRQFLEYLSSLEHDFTFHLYTIDYSRFTNQIIDKYSSRLGEKLVIHFNINRKELIRELSTIDFLINFMNKSNNQVPSKLIDYEIAARPICSLSTCNFNPKVFMQFLNKNYENRTQIDLKNHNIENLVNSILSLV